MRLLLYMVKRLITNPYNVGWSILFMLFWVLMGAYVLSSNVPKIVNAEKFYTAAWAGVIELLVLSSSSMTLTIILNYQTGGLPHLLRYSKLTPTYYIASLYSSNLIMQIVYSLILIIAVYTTFSNHFGINLYPKNVLLIVITLVISSLFFTSLSIFLNLIILRSTRKMQQLVDFIPLILGYGFGFTFIYLNMGSLVYFSPFAAIEALIISSYLNTQIPINFATLVTDNYKVYAINSPQFSIPIALSSIIFWTIFLSLIGIIGLRKLYYKPLEEGRIV